MASDDVPGDSHQLWRGFPHDPRDPAHAPLRASDADRDRIHQVLATAYAEGRLDRLELEERTEAVVKARTLGELPALVSDLVPERGPALSPAARWRAPDVSERARAAYLSQRQHALWGFLSASVICWVIWAATTGIGSFPWPLFVMLGTGLNVLRTLVMRGDTIAEETRRLERKQAKRRHELPPGSDT